MARTDPFAKSTLTIASFILVVAAVYFAKGVLVPIALAVLLSFLLSPVCDWFERRGLSRVPAVLCTAFLAFSLLGLVVWTAVHQMSELAPKLPEYQDNIREKFQAANRQFGSVLNRITITAQDISQSLPLAEEQQLSLGTQQRPFSVRVLSAPTSPLEVLSVTFGRLVEVLGLVGIVVVLVIFFLIRREDMRDRFIRLLGRSRLPVTTQVLEDAAARVSRYLLMLFVINASFGIAVTVGLFFIGVPAAILWGIMATTLRFIPYIGPWIAAAMPISLSMAISAGWFPPAMTIALFGVLELFSNNVMEPWLYGRNTGMSAVAVLIAAVFWTWLWGLPGLLLATPMTVCLLVIGKHISQFSFLDTLLGNDPVFDANRRIYHRLLADDQEAAAQLVQQELKTASLPEVFDNMLLPALALARTSRQRDEIEESRYHSILESLEELVYEMSDLTLPTGASTDIESPPHDRILCLPARDESDAVAGMMLEQLLTTTGCSVQLATSRPNFDELASVVEKSKATLIFVSAMPPSAVTHARHLCRGLRAQFPNIPVIVGLWKAQGDLAKASLRIGGGRGVEIVTSFPEAITKVQAMTAPAETPESAAARKLAEPPSPSADVPPGAVLPT